MSDGHFCVFSPPVLSETVIRCKPDDIMKWQNEQNQTDHRRVQLFTHFNSQRITYGNIMKLLLSWPRSVVTVKRQVGQFSGKIRREACVCGHDSYCQN